MRSTWRRGWLAGFWVLWLVFSGAAQPETPPETPLSLDEPVQLSVWKYRSGDDPRWADPNLDDRDWKLLNLDTQAFTEAGGRSGPGWYRATVVVADPSPLGLLVVHAISHSAYEAYVNGHRVGQLGRLAPQPAFPGGFAYAPLRIPAEACGGQGRLVIAVRTWEKLWPPLVTGGAFYGAQLGHFDRLDRDLQKLRAERMHRDMARVAMTLTIGFFALYHLYLYFSLYVYRGRSSQREYLWLSLFAAGYAMNSLSLSSLLLEHVSLLTYNQINVVSIQFQLITGAGFLFSFLKLPPPRWVRWFQITLGLVILGTLALPGWFLQRLVRDLIFAVPVATLLGFTGILVGREAWRGNVAARTLCFSMGLVILAEAVQVAKTIVLPMVEPQSAVAVWFAGPVAGYLVEISFGALLLTMAVAVARRYRDELDAINRNLEHMVAERTAEVQQQRDELEQKNQDIEDSLRYAQTMQQAVLPDIKSLHATFAEAFALWKPRDIVSGDFYWFHQTERACLVAVADCTGHGVPGAFMSFIGNDLLNQIVVERKIDDPARILAELDAGVQRALKQGSHESVSVEDGMDIGICRFTADGVTFAGARRPLYAVADGQLTEYAGSRHPIGGRARKPRHFENVAVAITSPMMLYLTTDGFADQPDAQGKRFKTGPLMQLLRDIATCPAGQQRAALETALAGHQGRAAQRDDITIVGLRLDASLVRWNGSTPHATS